MVGEAPALFADTKIKYNSCSFVYWSQAEVCVEAENS